MDWESFNSFLLGSLIGHCIAEAMINLIKSVLELRRKLKKLLCTADELLKEE